MRRSRKPIVIASRRSRLARIQAELVGQALGRLHPGVAVEYRWIESEGDRVLDRPLAAIGGKGLFTQTLEQVLLRGEADLAVHSLKDLPAQDSPGLTIAAVPKRWDARDCLIGRTGAIGLDDLTPQSVVGTSSPRRAAQLLRARPDLKVDVIRGNVDTRLKKVMEPEGEPNYDATLLALAGLQRMGLNGYITQPIDTDVILPAACQGALAIQCRADDHVALTRCLPLNDPTASATVHAERQLLAALGADCHSPIAVLCEPTAPPQPTKRRTDAQWFRLRVRVLSTDGQTCIEADESIRSKDLRRLVKQTAEDLMKRGAAELMAAAHPVQPMDRSPQTQLGV